MLNKKLKICALALFSILVLSACTQAPADDQSSTTETSFTNYLVYSREVLEEAYKNPENKTILYFYAPWCPTCRAFDNELKTENDQIPENVVIIQVDYDSEKELKKKYNISTQHTLVQLDQNGEEITKWVGGGIDLLKQELQ